MRSLNIEFEYIPQFFMKHYKRVNFISILKMDHLYNEENSLIEKIHNQVMRQTQLEEERAEKFKKIAAIKKELVSTERKLRQNELSRQSFLNRLSVLVRERESQVMKKKKKKRKKKKWKKL